MTAQVQSLVFDFFYLFIDISRKFHALQIGNHWGYMRARLCKLSSPNDRVTSNCMNENMLRIEPKENRINLGQNNSNELYVLPETNYVLNTPLLGFAVQYNFEF
jgi:hypothetical protein